MEILIQYKVNQFARSNFVGQNFGLDNWGTLYFKTIGQLNCYFADPSFGDVSGLPDPYTADGQQQQQQLAAAQQHLMSMGQQQQQVRN